MKRFFVLVFMLVLTASGLQGQQLLSVVQQLSAASTDCSTAQSCLVLNLQANASAATVQLAGTFSATVQFESTSNGSGWSSLVGKPWTGAVSVSSGSSAAGWTFDVSGRSAIRVRVSSYTSGAVLASISSSTAQPVATNNDPLSVQGTVANGSPLSTYYPVYVGGTDGLSQRALMMDWSGMLLTRPVAAPSLPLPACNAVRRTNCK